MHLIGVIRWGLRVPTGAYGCSRVLRGASGCFWLLLSVYTFLLIFDLSQGDSSGCKCVIQRIVSGVANEKKYSHNINKRSWIKIHWDSNGDNWCQKYWYFVLKTHFLTILWHLLRSLFIIDAGGAYGCSRVLTGAHGCKRVLTGASGCLRVQFSRSQKTGRKHLEFRNLLKIILSNWKA